METQKNETLAFYAHLFNLYGKFVGKISLETKKVYIGPKSAKDIREHMLFLLKALEMREEVPDIPKMALDFLTGERDLP